MKKISTGEDFSFELVDLSAPSTEVVLIIGNGFDLSFGLKTSYGDFLASKQFEKLILDGNLFADYLKSKPGLSNWIDIENELAEYSLKKKPETYSFMEEFELLSHQLIDYLSSIDISNLKSNCAAYALVRDLNEYNKLVIDFNYTGTFASVQRSVDSPESGKCTHIKLHGSLDENYIIFGTDDKSKILADHVFLKKSFHDEFKSTQFSKELKNCKTVIFFGHSLGVTDHMYFSKFFKQACWEGNSYSNKDIRIYHYGKRSKLEIGKQLDFLTRTSIGLFKQFNDFTFIDSSKVT